MKSKNKILYLLAIPALVLGSCTDDFLNLQPHSSVGAGAFYQTEDDFQQAVNGAYAPLQDRYGNGLHAAWAMGEMRSDNTHFIYNPGHRGRLPLETIADFLEEPGTEYAIPTKYNSNYSIIARANQVLSLIDAAEFDAAVKDNMKGQLHFLRAFAYFDLVQYFGGVPIHTAPISAMEESMIPRSSEEEVYELILDDLEMAVDLLPTKENQAAGRASKQVAYTLLGDVFITLKRWEDAEGALNEVTGYRLLDDYAEIFDPENKGNEELIFEAQFMQGATQGLESNFIYYFIPHLTNPSVLTGVSGPANTEGGYNVPTPDLIASYEEGDLRLGASVGFFTGEGYEDHPYIKKYLHDHSLPNNTDNNFPIYRYAEVLLMLAEAKNEQGETGEALGYLNQVRDRADLEGLDNLSQDQIRDRILQERRVELAFENKRWLDLVRSGNAVEVMNAYGERIKANPEDYYYPEGNEPFPASYNVTENRLLFPIPARETELNSLLE